MKFGQKIVKGAGALFFIQVFGTLGYSVLYSTVVLYATQYLQLSDTVATGIMASFIAFNFVLHLLGGYLGGRFLSYRQLFLISTLLMIAGCAILSGLTLETFYWGLAVFLAGSGFCSISINCLLTQLFEPEDPRRNTAFLWNYSGMNLGFFAGFSLAGYFQISQNYHPLFLLTSIGVLFSALILFTQWAVLRDVKTRLTEPGVRAFWRGCLGIFIILGLLFCLRWLLVHAGFSRELVLIVGASMLLVMLYIAYKRENIAEKRHIFAFIILTMASIIFFSLYQLLPMGLVLFIERNVARNIGVFVIPPQWFQNINSIIIIVGGPLLALLLERLRRRSINVSIPFLFATALVLIGLSMWSLVAGICRADATGLTHMGWVTSCYILLSIGELCLSPIGYSMVGLLAPVKLRGVMMGFTLMTSGIAAMLANYASNAAVGDITITDAISTNWHYAHTFAELGLVAVASGFIFYALNPMLKRLINTHSN